MKWVMLAIGVLWIGCASRHLSQRPPAPPPRPPMACSSPFWDGPTTFIITCENAVPPKGAEETVPTLALTNAAKATLLCESDYFYIDDTRLDTAAHLFQLRGVAIHPSESAPEGKLAIFTGTYVQPAAAQAIKIQARETRCQNALGNPHVPLEEQQSCGQFLSWREQVRTREMQQHAYDQQMAAQIRMEAELRRERIFRAIDDYSNNRQRQQEAADQERRHQELRRDLRDQRSRSTTTRCQAIGHTVTCNSY